MRLTPDVTQARRRLARRWVHLARVLHRHGDKERALDALTVGLLVRASMRLAKRPRAG